MDASTLSLWISLLAAVFTLAVGIWAGFINYRISRRTVFINTVTAERVKWIGNLRGNISAFSGLIHYFAYSIVPRKEDRTDKGQEIVRELDNLRYLIKLQLNPTDDKEIMESLDEIVNLTHQLNIDVCKNALDKLVAASQVLLKNEWDKVKDEAKKGDIRKEEYRKQPRVLRVGGWQRLGIVLSLLWIVGSGLAVIVIDSNRDMRAAVASLDACLRISPHDTGGCQKEMDNELTEYRASTREDWKSELPLFGFEPVFLGWLFAYITVWIVRWVRAGFQR